MALEFVWYRFKSLWASTSYIVSLLLYSATVSFLGSVLIYIIENTSNSMAISYVDSLFLAVSAYTASGLTTVDFTKLSAGSKVVFILIVQLGSLVLLTCIPSVIRYYAFKKERQKAEALDSYDRDSAANRASLQVIREQLDICRVIVVGCVSYCVLFQFLFVLLLLPSMPFSWAVFMTVSGFNNVGMSLSADSFAPWINDMYAISIFILIIPIGNTLFPVLFRLGVILLRNVAARLCSRGSELRLFGAGVSEWRHALDSFLLDPRKYYTHMFPRRDTLILFALWLALTTTEFLLFIPEYNNTEIFPVHMSVPRQMMVGLFQTVTVRTAGFTVVDLTRFRVGHLSFWILAMYLSAYPFILSSRMSSNRNSGGGSGGGGGGAAAYRKQAVELVGRDLVWLYLSIVVISFAENHHIADGIQRSEPSSFIRTFFEVSSAFGNVGLSLPMPNTVGVSFSASLSTFSKVVVVLIMWAGKHRGLPPAIDKSLMIHMSQIIEELPEMSAAASALHSATTDNNNNNNNNGMNGNGFSRSSPPDSSMAFISSRGKEDVDESESGGSPVLPAELRREESVPLTAGTAASVAMVAPGSPTAARAGCNYRAIDAGGVVSQE